MENVPLDRLTEKVGGKYRAVCLFQKRMRELMKGLPKLVDIESKDLMEIVVSEVLQDKVGLLIGEDAEKARKEQAMREAEEPEGAKESAEAASPQVAPAAPPGL